MKVWATRDEGPDGPLCEALRSAQLQVVHEPVIERRIRPDWQPDSVSELGPDDWLVLTSPYAVKAVARATTSRAPRVAVVGDRSRSVAKDAGYRVELVASARCARSLFADLRERISQGRVCFPRSSLAKPPEPWGRVELSSSVLYETVARDFDRGVVERIEIVAVVSPSAARAIGRIARPFATIGPTTTTALRGLKVEPVIEAADPSFESLADAIRRYATDSRHQRA